MTPLSVSSRPLHGGRTLWMIAAPMPLAADVGALEQALISHGIQLDDGHREYLAGMPGRVAGRSEPECNFTLVA